MQFRIVVNFLLIQTNLIFNISIKAIKCVINFFAISCLMFFVNDGNLLILAYVWIMVYVFAK